MFNKSGNSKQITYLILIIVFFIFILFGYLEKKFLGVSKFLEWGFPTFDKWRTVSFMVSVFFLVLIVYVVTRLNIFLSRARGREEAEISVFDTKKIPEPAGASRWEKVVSHLNSTNQTDWKLAILEADNICDELFAGMGYQGKGLGERLKNVQISDFKSLNDVWEAHKFRNQIVHGSPTHQIPQEEAKRVIGLYERGLQELGYL